ncbi:S1 family peptidase [Streptosporangium longisporum]|uniref:Alpha-lytic protease prodomain-containing protein n=1 Tax=Streptosporangium longisporum TaxID=46187 RepID=A0ABN3Y836_9ACTN
MSRGHAVTTGCVLLVTVLTLGAVPAGADPRRNAPAKAKAKAKAEAVTVPGTPAPSAGSAFKPPPGMVEAIVRDLALSPTQARARLLNEARLMPIAARLSRSLGPRFGGAWLRPKTAHTLMVATTSVSDIPQIVEAGAQAEVVSTSLAELTSIKQRLDTALPPHPFVSSVRYVDIKTNKVVVLTPEPGRAQNFIRKADVDRSSVVVLPSTEVPRPLYDLVGGTAYYTGVTSRCSIGFSVLKGTREGFVTAGHCGRKGSTTTGFNRVEQGVFEGSVFPGSDHSWVAVNDRWRATPTVNNGEGSTVVVTGAMAAVEGASICRSGSTTDFHCGLIQQRDASVTYPQGTVFGLTRTSVCAEPGDSGGSLISLDQAQGIASGGSGDCALGGVTYFQPIGEILTAYGLVLKTGAGDAPQDAGICTGYPGTLTGVLEAGRSAYHPRNVLVPGVHSGCLNGPDGSDFDLYLEKHDGTSWSTVAASEGAGPDARLTYTGTAGRYRYRVTATGGSGAYTLGFRAP